MGFGLEPTREQKIPTLPSSSSMLRLTRPLFSQALKSSTGITGLQVHPNPLPVLLQTYKSTLTALSSIPSHAVYRQSAEVLTNRKLKIVEAALKKSAKGGAEYDAGAVKEVEDALKEGQIEQSLDIANDGLALVANMVEWKPWEPLVEKPAPGQWEYFGKASS